MVLIAACGGGTATETPGESQAVATNSPVTQAPAPTTAPTEGTTSPTADPFLFVAKFEGTYSGTWKNTTFGSTGPASIELKLDRAAATMGLKITLGGNVFGNTAPAPEELAAAIKLGDGLSFTSTTFGETTVSIDLAGGVPKVTVSSPDVPSPRIESFTATASIADPNSIDFAYDVTFRDGTAAAHGTAKLTRP